MEEVRAVVGLVFLGLLGVAPMFAPHGIAWLILRSERKTLSRRWTGTASRLGGASIPIDAEAHRHVARVGSVDVQLTWTYAPGGLVFTRRSRYRDAPTLREEVSALLPRPLDLGLRIITSSWVKFDGQFEMEVGRHAQQWGEPFPYDACVGDPWLDDRFRFSSYEPMRMLHALTYEVRGILADIARANVQLDVSDDEVVLRREGEGGGDEVFARWAIYVVGRLADALSRASASVPRPPELRAVQAPLLRAAKAMRMRFDPAALAISGDVRGVRVVFLPKRVGPRTFGLLVRAMLPRQLPFPFRWPPRAALDVSSHGSLRLSLYRSPFERAFVEALIPAFDPLRQAGTIEVDERRADLQLYSLQDPRDVMRWVEALVEAVRRLDASIDGGRAGGSTAAARDATR